MDIQFAIEHHDHEYVERRGGYAFFSHVRGAAGRARYRDQALVRGVAIHEAAMAEGASSEVICGAGLIVLQRATLAAEDLGALLWALADDEPHAAADAGSRASEEIWPRLTSVTVPQLRDTFEAVLRDPSNALRVFRLPSDDALNTEDMSPEAMAAARRLRELTAFRWSQMLVRVAGFWMTNGDVAKSTMHGFAAIAGRQITEPPGAGFLADRVVTPNGPFVLMVNSQVSSTHVTTPLRPLVLDTRQTQAFKRAGSTAVKLTHELCNALANGIDLGYAFGIPHLLSHRLTDQERDALQNASSPDTTQEDDLG